MLTPLPFRRASFFGYQAYSYAYSRAAEGSSV